MASQSLSANDFEQFEYLDSTGNAASIRRPWPVGGRYRCQRSWSMASRPRKLCVLRFRMPFSVTVVFLRCSVSVRQTFRTAVYGPVRTVVWQESVGDHRPYADRCGGRWRRNHGTSYTGTKVE